MTDDQTIFLIFLLFLVFWAVMAMETEDDE